MSIKTPNQYSNLFNSLYYKFDNTLDETLEFFLDYKINFKKTQDIRKKNNYQNNINHLVKVKNEISLYKKDLIQNTSNIQDNIKNINTEITQLNIKNKNLLIKLNTLENKDVAAAEKLIDTKNIYMEIIFQNILLILIIIIFGFKGQFYYKSNIISDIKPTIKVNEII